MTGEHAKKIIWRFFDGKTGHDRQSTGLIKAISEMVPVDMHDIDVARQRISLFAYLTKRLPFGTDIPAPDLLIAAGRRCSWPMLAARRAYGGAAVYLMKPALPVGCFDLCVIPRHDSPAAGPTVIVSEGVLNDIAAADTHGDQGLILVGGPSSHYAWDENRLIEQIKNILRSAPDKEWIITDSRRTPPSTSLALKKLVDSGKRTQFVSSSDTNARWLNELYARIDLAWVSSDSVSMLYEALTAGVAVCVLEVPVRRHGRITRIVGDLSRRGMVTPYANWADGARPTPSEPLAEATRCASIILSRWDDDHRKLRPGGT